MTRRTPPEALHQHYLSLQERWQVSDVTGDYASLVTPTGNAAEPFHRWFHFKEGYSHALLERLWKDASYEPVGHLSVFDPFLGSGTTLLSAMEFSRRRQVEARLRGIERNPVMHTIGSAKLAAAQLGAALLPLVDEHTPTFWRAYRSLRRRWRGLSTESPTLNNGEYFDPAHVRSLLAMSRAAREIPHQVVSNLFLACVAAAVEPAGRIRRDGRALRFHPNKISLDPAVGFQRALDRALDDMALQTVGFAGHVDIRLGDARAFVPPVEGEGFDWAVFSPPYPNNIDYTEVYKAEAWALELFSSPEEMKAQRLMTLRSHPSITFPDEYLYLDSNAKEQVERLLAPLLAAVPKDRYERGRIQLVRGYVDDMLQVLRSVSAVMNPGGRCAVVVGNSAHAHAEQQFVVASDLLIARIAEFSGWAVNEIRVARRPKRRSDPHGWLRESIVLLSHQ
jgi:hypothetical protein